MTVQVLYKNKAKLTSSGAITLFTEEKFQIKNLDRFLPKNSALYAEEKKVYFAGGCFWCMEESFDQVEGVISTFSGYSGGHLKNPKYEDGNERQECARLVFLFVLQFNLLDLF